eukprot:2672314-Rhodomonas_salina.2
MRSRQIAKTGYKKRSNMCNTQQKEKLMDDLKASRLPLFSPHKQVSNSHFPARQVHEVTNPAIEVQLWVTSIKVGIPT